MNDQNLIPGNKRSPKEARENGRKGGIKSGETRRRQKSVKEAILAAIYAETGTGTTVMDEMIAGLIKRVIKTGDQAAFEKLMEYAGKSHKDRREETELKLKQAQAEQADRPDHTAADAWTGVLGQIREVMGDDAADD